MTNERTDAVSDETPQTEIPTEAQSELFPKTKVDFANEFLDHFQADVEAAEKSLVNARTKLRVARVLRDDAEENLRRALAEEAGTVDGQADDEDESSRQIEDAPKQIGAPVEDAEWTEEVDPITGEVEPAVIALYPTDGDGHPGHATSVGDRTRYGELVADYLAAEGLDEAIADYEVIGAAGDNGDTRCRDLENIIGNFDYGQRLVVRLREDAARERVEAQTAGAAA